MGEKDRSFIVYGKEIVFSEKQMRYNELLNTYRKRAYTATDQYMQEYYSYESWENFSNKGIIKGYRIIDDELQRVHLKLISEGYYTITLDRIKSSYYATHDDWTNLDDAVSEVNRAAGETMKETQELREFRKEARGRVVGGGFGVKGALQGMAFAGVANATTGFAHDIANAVGNARTARKIRELQNEVYDNPEFQEMVGRAIMKMVCGVLEIEQNAHKEDYEDFIIDDPSIEAMVENLSCIPRNYVEGVIVEVLQKQPYYYKVYSWILNNYGITKDVEDFASAFGMTEEINKERIVILDNYAEDLLKRSDSNNWDPEKAIKSCYDKRKYLNYYGELTENEAKIYRKKASTFIEKMDSMPFEDMDAERRELIRFNAIHKGAIDDYINIIIDTEHMRINEERGRWISKIRGDESINFAEVEQYLKDEAPYPDSLKEELLEYAKSEEKRRKRIQVEQNKISKKYSDLSDLGLHELERTKKSLEESDYLEESIAPYITWINELLQPLYEREKLLWKNKIDNAGLIELDSFEHQIKSTYRSESFIQELKDLIDVRTDKLKQKAIIEELEKYKFGNYEKLKKLWEDYRTDTGPSAKITYVGKQIISCINDEEERLLEEMCANLSDLSIEDLNNIKSSINESDYEKENKVPYIEKVDEYLLKRYKEREIYWSGIISSADLNQLDEIQEQIHREGLPKDITENMMSLICNQRNSLIHTLLLYTVEKLRYSPLDILKLFREEIIEYDLKDDVLGDILERTDNYILDSKRRLLAEKYGNISAMDINELKAAEKELVEADYEADIAIPYLKRIRDSIDMRNIGYLDSLTSDLGNYDEDKLKELSAIIQQFDCKDEIKVRYTSIISNQIHSRRIDKIKVDVDRADQLSFDELNSLIALIGEVDIDESLRQDCIAKVKPWLHWAQKSFVDEQLSTLSTMNRMEITKTDELLTAAEIPDFIMECGNKRIKERLLALDTKRINTLVPDFNVLTNRDVEDLKQQLSEMDLEEESKSSVIEKLEKRKWYNSLANIIMAADRFNQLTSGLNAHNLHVALYSSTYISMLDYYKTQGRISNSDEIPIFMIDGATSVAMSKSMLWIYNAGKLFSEYLYNIIAIQITSKLFSYDLIVSLTNGSNVSFSVQNGFPKKAVLAINTLIYELKQGKYASPIYPYEFTIQPFTLPAKEQHNAAVDLDYFVERFVEKDYSGIVLIDFGIAVKCCKQRDWSETERWLTETLGINSALKVIWYVDLSRFLNGREGFAVGIDYLYLQKQNQPLIIIPISEIRNLDINNNSLYISTMENTTYRVDFRGTNEALTIFRSSLEEFIDGIRMLQAKGMIENPQIPVNELNVGIEPQMTQEDGFGSRFNRFVGGFSKKTGTFTMSSFEKNVPQQERVESESAYVEPYNDTTVGDPFTQNIQFQSEQNREPIKAGRAFTDNRNGNTYDSNIGLEQQRFCYNCGKPITGDYVFCSYCGVKLK